MGVKNVSVVLDYIPKEDFTPGTTVSGRVVVTTDKPTQIKFIYILFEGKAKVSFYTNKVYWFKDKHPNNKCLEFGDIFNVDWNGITLRRRLSDRDCFRSVQIFASEQIPLTGESCLQLGMNEYPFSFILPKNLPSTFCYTHGHIRHKLKVKWAHSGFLSSVNTYKVELRVLNTDSLSQLQAMNPSYFVPREYNNSKSFRLLFSFSKPVTTVVTVPKSVFINREVVPAQIDIHNQSEVNIKTVLIKFVERTTWLGKHSFLKAVKMEDKLLQEIQYEGIPALGSRSWIQPIELLANPITNIDTCSVIKLCHFIVVEVIPSGVYSNLTWLVPIKIVSEIHNTILEKNIELGHLTEASTSGFKKPHDSQPPPYEGPPPYSEIN